MRLVYTAKSFSDISLIGEFIGENNPSEAERFVKEILARCRELQQFPEAFPLFAPERSRDIRRRVYGNYQIIYRTNGDQLVILHVLRSSRDLNSILFGDD